MITKSFTSISTSYSREQQEKMIAEDERIRTFIANRDSLTSSATKAVSGANKHNIMNEFFDFFKTSSVSSGFSKK